VEDFLQTKLGLSSDRILKLTASDNGETEPSEPPEQWPTYKNMVGAFRELAEVAQPGDQVYIHYSGHGGRTTTGFPDLKGPEGRDEALVPTDIGNSETQYLRDIELAHLLKTMVDKELIVTVVLDSCHSGGATRGPAATRGEVAVRGINVVDTTERPTESLVASDEELAETWRSLSEGATRNVKVGSGWLLEPQGYVLLAACRASESAMEWAFDGDERNGVLTYWLLDSLKQVGPGLTYKLLHDRILAKVHSHFEEQTPQLQGEGNRVVFGSEQVQPQYAVGVMEVDAPNKRVLLSAGQAGGLRKGAQFAVYPPGVTDFTQVDERLALVEITELGAADSWAKIEKVLRPDTIEQGAQAVLLDPGTVRLRRAVRLESPEDPALKAVGSVLSQRESGFVRLADEEEPTDFQVRVNDKGEYVIWDPAGTEIANLRPALRVDDDDAPDQVVGRLEHLARYRSVQELDNPDPMSPLARKLVVELAGKQSEYDPADKPEPQPFGDPGNTPTLSEGEWTFLRVRNTLSPGVEEDDPSRILNVTVLDLQPDWGIKQIYPSGAGAFESLDPDQEVLLPFRAALPDGYTEGTDVIKVLATVETPNFRWLELPPLDKLPRLDEPISRSATLPDEPENPLEELMATVTAEKSTTRNLNLATYPSRGWTAAQVEVRVQRQETQEGD